MSITCSSAVSAAVRGKESERGPSVKFRKRVFIHFNTLPSHTRVPVERRTRHRHGKEKHKTAAGGTTDGASFSNKRKTFGDDNRASAPRTSARRAIIITIIYQRPANDKEKTRGSALRRLSKGNTRSVLLNISVFFFSFPFSIYFLFFRRNFISLVEKNGKK